MYPTVHDTPLIEDLERAAQEQVQQSLGSEMKAVQPDHRSTDLKEKEKIQEFCGTTCGCHLLKGGPCSSLFTEEHYTTTRAQAAELSWTELDMLIMGQVMALTHCDAEACHFSKEREKSTMLFHHHGHRICRNTFLFLHGIGKFRFKASRQATFLKAWFRGSPVTMAVSPAIP